MYQTFYQLKETPFNVTADPAFYFSSKSHSEAISSLKYGIDNKKGILVISGEVGTGKTTLCKILLNHYHTTSKFALILNPKFTETQLMQMILRDLGIKTVQKNKFELVQELNEFLLIESARGGKVILLIDESQNLTVSQLEQIRLLSNLETDKEKLLQIILVGQPELYQKLQLPSLRQLRQRIAVFYNLKPLEKNDIKHYIHHRIHKAAERSDTVAFTDAAIDVIYQYTKGSPRTINILCDRALLAGFVAETYSIDEHIIKDCAKEVMYFEHHL